MASTDSSSLLLISILVFVCVTLLSVSTIQTLTRRARLRRRYGSLSPGAAIASGGPEYAGSMITIDPARLGFDPDAQRLIRIELIRAGFFSPSAIAMYALARVALLLALPVIGFLLVFLTFPSSGATERIAVTVASLAVAYYLPNAYLSRTQRRLETTYRVTFPDFLDMLVVCINAGLSLEAGLDRAARELDTDLELRSNLDLMTSEIRAGKGTSDALKAFADRLGLREARSFAALMQQTIELGTDIAQALTTFSDEMRDKRMSNAESKASALPSKLTLPLGLCIFPVVLIAVLAPAVLKLMQVIGR